MESPPRSRIIERPRLTRLLDETDARIILLVAPAGYGKTTLARQWVAAGGRRHGWHACTSASLDVAALAAGIARAASEVVPGAGRRMVERLRAEGAPAPTPSDLAGMLAEDLKEWPDDAWLVLDDYHSAMESEASEELVAEFQSLTRVRLLATSRHRPPWATARRLVYGEILEISQTALALTHEEAEHVLAGRDLKRVTGIMALADGWPAVVGLASHARNVAAADDEFPANLYEYCADELLSSAPSDVRADLSILAIPAEVTVDFLNRFLGNRATRVIEAAVRIGFLSQIDAQRWMFHPLLRAFLLQRLVEDSRLLGSDTTRAVSEYLLEKGYWDEVYALIEAAKADTLLEPLIEAALPDLLTSGRTETLRRWSAYGTNAGLAAPILDFVEAELAFRAGHHATAMRAAVKAATARSDSAWASRAWLRAAQAANLADRLDEAAHCVAQARACADTPRDLKAVLRMQFTVGIEREDADVDQYLDEFSSLAPLSQDEEVWKATASLFRATRFGGIEEALADGRTVLALAEQVPAFVRTGFLQTFAHSLALSGRYDEALYHVDRELQAARRAGLAFVVPHAFALKALASAGLRRFRASRQSIESARRHASAHEEAYFTTFLATLEARVHLLERRADLALSVTDPGLVPPHLNPSLSGEFHAVRALACACLGRADEATEESRRAQAMTRTTEARVLALAALAVTATRSGAATAGERAVTALRAAAAAGDFDSLALAYRAEPALLGSLSAIPDADMRWLRESLVRTRDLSLAPQALQARLSLGRRGRLSPREEEVLELVSQGMTNREIAARLFIAEVTVKVHVRHIFEKLGVRSRTEAALRGVRQSLDS